LAVPPSRQRQISLGLAALLLLTIVGLSHSEWLQYHRVNVAAAKTRDIIDTIDHIRSGMLNAETAERGFLLTGEDRYLAPYLRARQNVPGRLALLDQLMASRPGGLTLTQQLTDAVRRKFDEMAQTIELRRVRGSAPALAEVLSDRGRVLMEEIRGLCSTIQSSETQAHSQAEAERETAARTTLLVTIAGSLILIFLFTAGFEPARALPSRAVTRHRAVTYGAAVAAVMVATLLRVSLTPLIGQDAIPFITYFPAVLFAAWYGGLAPGALCVLLSTLASWFYFVSPSHSLLVTNPAELIGLLLFILVAFGILLLSDSQRRAVARADLEATHRKQAEDAEREQRERFETTLASIGDGVIATDAQGRIVFANDVALAILRGGCGAVVGRHFNEVLRIVNDTTREPVESPVSKVLSEGQVVGLANHSVLIALDGSEVPIDDSGAPIRDSAGSIQGTVMVFRDISERKSAEERLAQLNADLEKVNRTLARTNEELTGFAFVTSHDLQEPLRMISTYAELLIKKYPAAAGSDVSMFVETIANGTRRMQRLLADLLAYAEIGAPAEEGPEPVSLSRVIDGVRQNLKAAIEESGAVITCDDLPSVRVAESHLIPLFQNLIGNAIKYHGEEPPRIRISARPDQEQMRFAVADNGIGIASEYHRKIFGVFKRLHNGKVPGTGIGLAICQRVVERYGGRIWVESQEGKGSTFYFTLPSAKPHGATMTTGMARV
jgi:PAS domain S-box-containing protein